MKWGEGRAHSEVGRKGRGEGTDSEMGRGRVQIVKWGGGGYR